MAKMTRHKFVCVNPMQVFRCCTKCNWIYVIATGKVYEKKYNVKQCPLCGEPTRIMMG